MVRCEDRAGRRDRDDVQDQHRSDHYDMCGGCGCGGGGCFGGGLDRSQEAEAARCGGCGGGCGERSRRELFGGLFWIFVF